MESWLTSFITQSLNTSFGKLVLFLLESLALVGFTSGIILMTTLGTFIGDGRLSFIAWISVQSDVFR